eukprot:4464567-Pyramimonas_sp.AAC.1
MRGFSIAISLALARGPCAQKNSSHRPQARSLGRRGGRGGRGGRGLGEWASEKATRRTFDCKPLPPLR